MRITGAQHKDLRAARTNPSSMTPRPASDLPYRAYYFCIFAAVALMSTYLNLYFRRSGMSDSNIGWLSGTMAVLGVVSPPIWGAVSDSMASKRKPAVILLASTGLLYPCFLAVHSFTWLLALTALFGFFFSPVVPLADAATMAHLHRCGGDYGRIRVWGSIGFTIVVSLSGYLLPGTHGGAASTLAPIFIAFSVWRLLGILCALLTPEDAPPQTRIRARFWSAFRESASAFRSPRMALFMICGFLGWGAMQAYYVFFPIYLDALKVSDRHKGLFIGLGVLAEIGFLSQVGRVQRRIGAYGLFTLGIAAQAIRLFFFAYRFSAQPSVAGLAAIAAAQLLHAFTFAAFYVACIAVLTAEVPDRLRAGGQTFFSALVLGLGGFTGAALAGNLAHAYNMGVMFGVSSAIAAVGCALSTVLLAASRNPAAKIPKRPAAAGGTEPAADLFDVSEKRRV